ncbi:Gfo/Idh/MocA family protein [Vibrio sp. SCSIO 43137]|uniref:Gfo/Idh/MocA family protein n=1 Tax=Vibrio sp. SCSIO 43137 TaxID=3021011 RepID=UPI0023080274|nr:Gfo/Idh/MocA family oxidoreductase [Vibrio sp. SCSIO 43137]WCE32231.1 Gfo/Idh/MocA family oxidoreductase [Vibrio sp. SCSIO 43137]
MINLAVIGTNWITERFVEAAIETGRFQLSAVYSRAIDSAEAFCTPLQAVGCHYYDNLDELAADTNVDAVYIASPNSLHCQQACLMMEHKKHVICEKPVASNFEQAQQMYATAEENNVVLFEAFKTEFLPNFEELKRNLPNVGKLNSVYLSYCQYSSRYQKYLNGENPNTFNPAFSNGSIMDIGYYCVAAAVSLFGKPEQIQASAKLLSSGVDGHGLALLSYPNFIVTVQHSKVSDGYVPSEIQGEEGVILLDHFSECSGFTLQKRGGQRQEFNLPQAENTMSYEADVFADQIEQGYTCSHCKQRSLEVAEVIAEIRKQTGVVFPADQ